MNSGQLPNESTHHGIELANVPTHVACVMDGNGRWAGQRGLIRTEGHAAGERSLTQVVEAAIEIGVKWLTVYAFSTENWTRPADEVAFLMKFNEQILEHKAGELNEENVRLIFAGRRSAPVPESLAKKMDEVMELTKNNDRLTLTVAFNYGSRAEIVDAMKALLQKGIAAEEIDEAAIQQHLYVPEMPDVDLMIRTSNEVRISNFLLWQVAYGELYFTDTLWPDFGKEEFFAAVREYQQRSRRFGGLDQT